MQQVYKQLKDQRSRTKLEKRQRRQLRMLRRKRKERERKRRNAARRRRSARKKPRRETWRTLIGHAADLRSSHAKLREQLRQQRQRGHGGRGYHGYGGHDERTVTVGAVNDCARGCAALIRALFRAMRLPEVRSYVLRPGRGVKSLSWMPSWIRKEGATDCLVGDAKFNRLHPTMARAHDAAIAALAEARALDAVTKGNAGVDASSSSSSSSSSAAAAAAAAAAAGVTVGGVVASSQRAAVIAQYSSGDIRHEVYGAGVKAANGVYRWLGWAQGAKMFVRRVDRNMKYTVFRCKLEKGGLQVRVGVDVGETRYTDDLSKLPTHSLTCQ